MFEEVCGFFLADVREEITVSRDFKDKVVQPILKVGA